MQPEANKKGDIDYYFFDAMPDLIRLLFFCEKILAGEGGITLIFQDKTHGLENRLNEKEKGISKKECGRASHYFIDLMP